LLVARLVVHTWTNLVELGVAAKTTFLRFVQYLSSSLLDPLPTLGRAGAPFNPLRELTKSTRRRIVAARLLIARHRLHDGILAGMPTILHWNLHLPFPEGLTAVTGLITEGPAFPFRKDAIN
jgi:hypothetical protein